MRISYFLISASAHLILLYLISLEIFIEEQRLCNFLDPHVTPLSQTKYFTQHSFLKHVLPLQILILYNFRHDSGK